jgi:hypothetical protein
MPRIHKSAPFTPEDHDTVAELVLYRRGICWLAGCLTISYEADRGDALVMFHRARHVKQCIGAGVRVMPPALYWGLYPWRR